MTTNNPTQPNPTQPEKETTKMNTPKTPQDYRDLAHESWLNSDTDGALSQMSYMATARFIELEAQLAKQGGLVKALVLFDLEGNWTPAKIVKGTYGESWLVLDANGKSTGVFVPMYSVKRQTQAKRGYVEGYAMVPAVVKYVGDKWNFSAAICPIESGTLAPVSVVTVDRFTAPE
jgi:hypothetical protein